ncbi:UROD/MetE-like protein, partial [Aureobasidium melanogenum]|uniref:UROD/MetE-like protein n=2 Tax=Aureobasidium melanogenum TaxID=46634 RepID=A0A074WDU9_AURM1
MVRLPFHAEHIGSLLRPADLQEAKTKAANKQLSDAELEAAEHKAITHIVKRQQDEGVRPICSGEYDRKVYFGGFFEELDGFEEVEDAPWDLYRLSAPPIAALKKAGLKYPMTVVCNGKIAYKHSPYLKKWEYLKSQVPESQWADCKFTMPPAPYFHLRLAPGKCYPKEVYPTDAAFFADLAECYKKEFKALHDAGLKSVQIDDPTLAYFCSKDMLEGLKADGVDPDELFELYCKAHNDCLEGRPEGLHVGLHICRGNFSKSMHFSQGSYEQIAERFFKTLNYDTFYLEYDDARSGGFEPLRFLPKNKNVVLGVVSTKVADLEDAKEMKDKVLEAADIIAKGQGVSREQAMECIGISPQCGFASTGVGAEAMTEDKMFAKLALVKKVANELWPDRA